MPPLTIPDTYRPGLAAILKLSPTDVDALVSLLSVAHADATKSDLLRHSIPGLADVPFEIARDVVISVTALYSLRAQLELTAQDITSSIIESVQENHYHDLMIPDEEIDDFRTRLDKLLDINTLFERRKIQDVIGDHERTYCSARILTDIRPVFGVDPEDDIIDSRVTHSLKLTYHESGDTKEIFIAIDDENLQELRAVLDRAETKARKLRDMIERFGSRRAD